MEYTEIETAKLLTRNGVMKCVVESNNGGRGFARAVEKNCRYIQNDFTMFQWFTQTKNKDVRIFSNSAAVQNLCIMPSGWQRLFPEFAKAIMGYMKVGKNEHDDAPDALTGTVERRVNKGATGNVASLFG